MTVFVKSLEKLDCLVCQREVTVIELGDNLPPQTECLNIACPVNGNYLTSDNLGNHVCFSEDVWRR